MPKLNLNELTNRLFQDFLPIASCHRSLLVNDVPADLCINSDRELAASVIRNLLSSIVSHAENSSIRLSAKVFDSMILLGVTDGNGYNDCGIIESRQLIQPLVKKMGTVVKMDKQGTTATINFNFSNPAA